MIASISPPWHSGVSATSFGISSANSPLRLPANLRCYDLHHAAASLLLADGMPTTAVSAMLGHALASTTLNTHARVLPGADRLTADVMERLLG